MRPKGMVLPTYYLMIESYVIIMLCLFHHVPLPLCPVRRSRCTGSKNATVPFSVKISVFRLLRFRWSWRQRQKLQNKLPLGVFGSFAASHADPECTTLLGSWRQTRRRSNRLAVSAPFRRSRVGSLCDSRAPRLGLMCEVWAGQGSRGTRRASGPQRPTLTRGRRGEATLWFFSVLRLSNEALLIQIRVNDYLIIPILQRAPSPSILCSVDVQRTNPESVPRHETVARCTPSGQTSNMNKSYMFQGDTAITRDCFKSAQTAGICFIYF